MPHQGELTYYEAIGEAGRQHALNKPFSDAAVGSLLMQIGAIMQLLPAPPAHVLECGCGTGWLSQMLQKSGYQVTGVDVAPAAIELAESFPLFHHSAHPQFSVAEVEQLPFNAEFDAVIFFDALHHSADEQAAVNSAYRALKRGGVCIASETPAGHAASSREIVERYGVIEKDMPPHLIARLGQTAGFSKIEIYPRADEVGKRLYSSNKLQRKWITNLFTRISYFNYLTAFSMMFRKHNYGITVLTK